MKRESDHIKETLNIKLQAVEKEYIRIGKHEEILNQELQRCEATMTEKLKKVKEQMHSEIVKKLEEKELDREKTH